MAGVLLGAGDGAEAALLLAPLEGPQHGVSVLQLDRHRHRHEAARARERLLRAATKEQRRSGRAWAAQHMRCWVLCPTLSPSRLLRGARTRGAGARCQTMAPRSGAAALWFCGVPSVWELFSAPLIPERCYFSATITRSELEHRGVEVFDNESACR